MSTAIGTPSRQIIGNAEQLADSLNYINNSADYRKSADEFRAISNQLRKIADEADHKRYQELKSRIDELYPLIQAQRSAKP